MKFTQFVWIALLVFISQVKAEVINFNWPKTAPVSDKYEVYYVEDGIKYPIHTHYSKPNLNVDPNHPTEGSGVTGYLQDRSLSYVQFDYTGEVKLIVTKIYGTPASRVEIQPNIFGIQPTYFDGRTVVFTLKHYSEIPSYVSVNFVCADNIDDDAAGGDNIKNSLMIFGNEPETEKPSPDDAGVVVYSKTADLSAANIIYFKAGDYDLRERFTAKGEVGQMPYTKNGLKIYLEGGAFVRGAFHGKGYDNIWLYGRGIVTGQDLAWHWFRDDSDKKDAFCNFIGCSNIHLEGYVIENPTHHTTPSSDHTYIKNIKIIGWASNHDGIRPASDSEADGIFIKTSDDQNYARDRQLIKNSIFWPMNNGAIGMLGWNNLGIGYTEFENCVFINSETKATNKGNTGIIGSMADDGIKLQQNKLTNLYIEDKHAYLVNAELEIKNSIEAGYLKDFTFKNITTEYPFALPNGTVSKQKMKGLTDNWIEGFTFTNLVVDGILVTWDNYKDYFILDLTGTNGSNSDNARFVKNVTFDTEGTLYEISITSNGGGSFHPKGDGSKIVVPAGMNQMVSIVANSGKKIANVIVDGTPKGRMQTVFFESVSANHAIEIEFADGNDYFWNSSDSNLVSIYQPVNVPSFKAFPNPVADKLYLDFMQESPQSVSVFNTDGKLLIYQNLHFATRTSIDIELLASGLYILVADFGNYKESLRFIKK